MLPGLQNAEFNLKGYLTAIPFLGMEGLVQLDYAVVPLIEARMNDATNVTLDRFATDLFNNLTNNASMIGLPGAVDDGTFLATYGGVNRLISAIETGGANEWSQSLRPMGKPPGDIGAVRPFPDRLHAPTGSRPP